MTEFVVKIIKTENLTHDVKRFEVERPKAYTFVPGQATEVAINSTQWKNEARPFTFTGLDDQPNLEFIIKAYPAHQGVTNALHNLSVGDELLIHDVWGAIRYKGEGVFIAGGAGITPFIAILRQLYKNGKTGNNKLIFSNKTMADIILKEELEMMLGKNFINVITDEPVPGIRNKRIDKEYLQELISSSDKHFYVCGPEKFTETVINALTDLGVQADKVVIEK